MNPPPDAPSPAAEPLYRAGSLVYTAGGMRAVFAWLLLGEAVFTLIDMLEPKVLPVLLKLHGATDRQIGIIVGSFNAALQLLIMPPLGYRSDRLRTRWGRRLPILLWATPFASLFLAMTPFAPDFAGWLGSFDAAAAAMGWFPVPPAVLMFAVLVILFRTAQTAVNVSFFGLLRDVVPDSHMGRFLALFRLVGAGSAFVLTFWLLGYAETHSKPIFVGVALLNLAGFFALCWFVREGEYPAVERPSGPSAPWRPRWLLAFRTFVAESYRHPVYLWAYATRSCIYGALIGLSGFYVFFPQHELGMDLLAVGQMLSWPSLAWLFLAYPVGRLIDARGALPILAWGLGALLVGYVGSFFLVIGPKTFFASAMITGVAFWVVMLAQLKLTQEIFHRDRYSQLAGANTVVQSIFIAVIVSPGAGWLLDALQDWRGAFSLPWVGQVSVGPYRTLNLMLGALYGLALFGVSRIRRHWLANGGPNNYKPPV